MTTGTRSARNDPLQPNLDSPVRQSFDFQAPNLPSRLRRVRRPG